jgi:photosystem II stability/assembly factor-like uncharacterized protein
MIVPRKTNKVSLILISVALSFFSLIQVRGQNSWVPTNGPYGGYCYKIQNINNEIFAATNCGIYSTDDEGVTWKNKTTGLGGECKIIQDIDMVNNTIVAGSLDSGVYISNNFGNSWTKTTTGFLNGSPNAELSRYVYDILINGNDILVGTANGVYKSTNSGVSWTSSNIGINETPNINANRLVKNGSIIILQTLNQLYKSSDNGFTWINLNNTIGAISPTLISNGGAIFVLGDLGLYKSTNNGLSWTLINNNLPDLPTQLFESGNNLYCSVNSGGTYVSSDAGVTWQQVCNFYFSSFLNFNNKIFGASAGVYSWANGSQNIKNCGLGGASYTNDLFQDVNNLYSGSDNGVYLSNNNGNTWINLNKNLPLFPKVQCITKSGSNLIIGTKDYGIYISNDNGVNWNQSNLGLSINGISCLNITELYTYNGRVFLGAKQNTTFYNYAALFVSDNNGSSWSIVSSGLGTNYNITSVCNFGAYTILGAKDEFSTTTFNDGVYLSTDNGNNWLFDGLNGAITDVTSNSNSIFACIGDIVYSSSDLGNTWNQYDFGAWNDQLNILTNLDNTIFTMSNNGIYYLANSTWINVNSSGLSGSNKKALCKNNSGDIFIGSNAVIMNLNGYTVINNGVSKYTGNPVGIEEVNDEASMKIYPNPMNSKTTFEITSELLGLKFMLMDQFGKVLLESKIQDLFTEIDLSNYSKGVYYLKLDNPTVGIKKIVKQ